MALQRLILLFFTIILPLIFSCYSLQDYHYIDEEFGYDSRAYPSYFSTIEDSEFKSLKTSGKVELKVDDFGAMKTSGKVELKVDDFGAMKTSGKVELKVDDFGAKGDGTADDTKAFEKAWEKACSSVGAVVLVVPLKNYLLKPIRFSGPCKSDITMQVYGAIEASDLQSDYAKDRKHWLVFENVQNLLVQGGGTINGNGNIWWKNSCKINKSYPCTDAPTALTFSKCKNLRVNNLKIQNAQQIHLSFERCMNVQASHLTVTAPGNSPNTDGIHVTETQNIQITNCIIGTGDDCISIVSGSQNVQAMDTTCGPGHGISIGSLGAGNSEAHVSDVVVNRAKLSGTTNGVRIKTWQGGSGTASNISFLNIEMHDVTNPMIIDQNYCDQQTPSCKKQGSAVQIKNVLYQNIRGTSASDVAVQLDCSESFPCQGIVLGDINLQQEGGTAAKALCNNVKFTTVGLVSPHCP